MKTYKTPRVRMVELEDAECIIQTSGEDLGLNKSKASVDDNDNQFSKMLNIVNMGDDEEMTWE